MDISAGLIAKGTLGAGALAAAGAGYNYRNEIGNFLTRLRKTAPAEPATTNDNASLNEKIKGLGIEECELDSGGTFKECTGLDEGKLKKINFSNKDSADLTVTGNPNVNLKIEKVSGDDLFTENLKFTFTSKGETDVEIKKESDGDATKITLKKDVPYEFKIKNGENKIEKAWTLNTLGEKAGLNCNSPTSGTTTGECTFKEKANLWKDEEDYIFDGVVTDHASQKITYAEDTANYFEGLKFTVNTEVSLTGGTPKKAADGISKLTASGKTYEIGVKDVNNEKKWFLIEKGN